jgi:phosphohistidine phosphatase
MERALYLIQHGEAADEKTDPARPLTQKGRSDVAETARFMREVGVEIDEVWHSTKLRARQTAEIIAKTLRLKYSFEKGCLNPNDPVASVADMINHGDKNIAIVGHLPFLAKLASFLLTGVDYKEVVRFKQGGVVCLRKKGISWGLDESRSFPVQ